MNLILKVASIFVFILSATHVEASSVSDIVTKVKPSVVGVGLYDAMSAQTHQLRGTGFAFGDGSLIATNHHVVSIVLDPKIVQYLIVFAGQGAHPTIYRAEIVAKDIEHDIAILKIAANLPALRLADDSVVADGNEVLLTGFPIGAVLGLYPATHRGIVAAFTPDVIPSMNSTQLSNRILDRLDKPSMIYQLDITAYPGNSGSPLYNAQNGDVIGILNKVFVKETKESVIEKPSGISYAIPVKYLRGLTLQSGLAL
ncbi:serine protease [Paraglaciecola sp. 25GB23A]|uniref:S1 family peptidase n=1 Tax=Paraglaciecola sp. 25GB23A TaxID=3156068 RepID=UPI0032AFAEA3